MDYQTGLWEKYLVTGDWSQSSSHLVDMQKPFHCCLPVYSVVSDVFKRRPSWHTTLEQRRFNVKFFQRCVPAWQWLFWSRLSIFAYGACSLSMHYWPSHSSHSTWLSLSLLKPHRQEKTYVTVIWRMLNSQGNQSYTLRTRRLTRLRECIGCLKFSLGAYV